jgi:hypothetical protein
VPGEATLEFEFDATVIEWRGPAPFFYAPVPAAAAADIRAAAKLVSYGWGVIPVEVRLNGSPMFTTSLFPRDGTYLVPLKDKIRRPAGITVGDPVHIELTLQPRN